MLPSARSTNCSRGPPDAAPNAVSETVGRENLVGSRGSAAGEGVPAITLGVEKGLVGSGFEDRPSAEVVCCLLADDSGEAVAVGHSGGSSIRRIMGLQPSPGGTRVTPEVTVIDSESISNQPRSQSLSTTCSASAGVNHCTSSDHSRIRSGRLTPTESTSSKALCRSRATSLSLLIARPPSFSLGSVA